MFYNVFLCVVGRIILCPTICSRSSPQIQQLFPNGRTVQELNNRKLYYAYNPIFMWHSLINTTKQFD